MKNIWVKWTILVWLNALVGFLVSLLFFWQSQDFILGMALGIFAFVPLYVSIDYKILHAKNQALQQAFYQAIFVRIISQAGGVIDIMAGIGAYIFLDYLEVSLNKSLFNMQNGFLQGLVLTLVTGSILSVVVAIFTGINLLFFRHKRLFFNAS